MSGLFASLLLRQEFYQELDYPTPKTGCSTWVYLPVLEEEVEMALLSLYPMLYIAFLMHLCWMNPRESQTSSASQKPAAVSRADYWICVWWLPSPRTSCKEACGRERILGNLVSRAPAAEPCNWEGWDWINWKTCSCACANSSVLGSRPSLCTSRPKQFCGRTVCINSLVISISQDQYSAWIWNCALQPVLEMEKEANPTFLVWHFAEIRNFYPPITQKQLL